MHSVFRHCETQLLYCVPPKTATKHSVAQLQQEGSKVCQPMTRKSDKHGYTLEAPQLLPDGCVRIGTLSKHNKTRNKYGVTPVKRRRIEEESESEPSCSENEHDVSESEQEGSWLESDSSNVSSEHEMFPLNVNVSQQRLLYTALAANLQPHVVESVRSLNGKVCIYNEYVTRGKCWACNRTRRLTHRYGDDKLVGSMCGAKINAAVKACISLRNAQIAQQRSKESIYNFINTAQNITDHFL